MKSFIVVCVFATAIAIGAACSKAVSLPEYQKLQSEADVPRISVEDAKKDADAGIAVIVDSRADVQYKSEHVAGSINVPLGSQIERFSELPKDKKIIVYCS